VKIYNIGTKFYPTKKEAIAEAQAQAAPKWEEDRFVMDIPAGIGVGVIELSNIGQACDLLNTKTFKAIGYLRVTADMSIRDITNPEAKITFTTERENFDD